MNQKWGKNQKWGNVFPLNIYDLLIGRLERPKNTKLPITKISIGLNYEPLFQILEKFANSL